MKKLSSKTTYFSKKIVPIVSLCIVAVVTIFHFLGVGETGPDIIFLIGLIITAVFVYYILKTTVLDLIDEAYDDGNSLLFRNSDKEVRILLKDIKNVNIQTMMNPQKVTLSIRHDTELGKELSFLLPMSLIPHKKNKDIEELIDRIDHAKG